jgi:hypothetical protein
MSQRIYVYFYSLVMHFLKVYYLLSFILDNNALLQPKSNLLANLHLLDFIMILLAYGAPPCIPKL